MIKNTRTYLKSHIDESVLLDESDDSGLTEVKELIVSIVNKMYNAGINPLDPTWVIHHMDNNHSNNDFNNIALMVTEAHSSFHGSGYLGTTKNGYTDLVAWLNAGAKSKGKGKTREVISYLHDVYILQDIVSLHKKNPKYWNKSQQQ